MRRDRTSSPPARWPGDPLDLLPQPLTVRVVARMPSRSRTFPDAQDFGFAVDYVPGNRMRELGGSRRLVLQA